MKLLMLDGTYYIDLDMPVAYSGIDSEYPFGFIAYNITTSIPNWEPDRCEYLLMKVEHPELLQTLLDIMPEIRPELYI